jgi:hypothetical protein
MNTFTFSLNSIMQKLNIFKHCECITLEFYSGNIKKKTYFMSDSPYGVMLENQKVELYYPNLIISFQCDIGYEQIMRDIVDFIRC